MAKFEICKDRDAARALLLKGTVDVALVDGSPEVTYLYWLLMNDVVPDGIENLSGYRFVGTSGYPTPMATARCYHRASEVLQILSRKERVPITATAGW